VGFSVSFGFIFHPTFGVVGQFTSLKPHNVTYINVVRNASGQFRPMTKEIIIDGDNFSTLMEFYDEVESKLTKGLDWRIGRNLDAFNDVLRGGFGVHEYEEPIAIKWFHSDKSKKDLGQAETIKYIGEKLKRCHPTNISSVEKDLQLVKNGKGQILFDIIVDILQGHDNIELKIE
jgi:RNAse (barnase) inhibitor barstar